MPESPATLSTHRFEYESEEPEVDPRFKQDPVDLEYPVDPQFLIDPEDFMDQEEPLKQEIPVVLEDKEDSVGSENWENDSFPQLSPSIISYINAREMKLMKKFEQLLEETAQGLKADIRGQGNTLEMLKEQIRMMQDAKFQMQPTTSCHAVSPESQDWEVVSQKHTGQVKRSLPLVKEAKRFCDSALPYSLTSSKELEESSAQMEFWKGYPNAVYSVRDPSQSSDAMYVVVPLLGVALLIVIALFIIWRCQLQKATRHHPSYAQNRYLASRAGHSLPRVMVYRGTVHSQGESSGHREAGSSPQVVLGSNRGGRTTVRLESTLYLPELSLSRLSSATPPPSYEEVTAPQESSSEEASISYSDPPPKYEEIVAANPGSDK
ncbi:Transmembrane gamma-carboxyglutamic acid protein 3 [Tupaia chinensis]|uniref:Transmembrane gamma-carboxyglutamic acid protein 3 n=1 Tax=Tupaia chinensis TaxID=246437 RepID=L8Y3F2_TUPCH|nr:Transmembrane gamma-carboxyglutamic acid protein 3 [Tupaia chinensis]